MSAYTVNQLFSFAQDYQSILLGAQLQAVYTSGDFLILQLYSKQDYYLIFDCNPVEPKFFCIEDESDIRLFKKSKTTKPLALFLNSNAKNLRLMRISVVPELGRVIDFVFSVSHEEDLSLPQVLLRFVAIPRTPNLIAEAATKKISWNKPKDLPLSTISDIAYEKVDWKNQFHVWAHNKFKIFAKTSESGGHAENGAGQDATVWAQAQIQKKQKALSSIEKSIQENQASLWRFAGNILKSKQRLPENFREEEVAPYDSKEVLACFDSKKSFSENLETCYAKARQFEQKNEGARERAQILKKEIGDLERQISEGTVRVPQISKVNKKMHEAGVRTRKLQLADGIEAYLGKSASDNLALLRKAQPWDAWLHLRDFPGAHVIVRLKRGQVLSPAQLQEIGSWLIDQTVSKKKVHASERVRYDVLLAECRFVRPIKGDKLGRVQYQNERTITVWF